MVKSTSSLALAKPGLDVHTMQAEGAHGPLEARLYRSAPSSTRRDSLIVFFHGGAFVGGNITDADDFLRRLVLLNPRQLILATDYTLAHVCPFPAALEDAYAVLSWTRKNKSTLGWNGKQLVVAGIDAGANLAAVCAILARDRKGPDLAGQVLIMPMLDPSLTSGSMRRMMTSALLSGIARKCVEGYRDYLPSPIDRMHPYASPLQSSRLKNLPPALILSAEDDPLREEAEQYAEKLICHGTHATVRCLPFFPMLSPGDRPEFATNANAQSDITHFIAALSNRLTP